MEVTLENMRNDKTKTTQKFTSNNNLASEKEKEPLENSNKRNKIRKGKPRPSM